MSKYWNRSNCAGTVRSIRKKYSGGTSENMNRAMNHAVGLVRKKTEFVFSNVDGKP